uniref:Uncharacterized protein n=1 Tax=Arundo donax TaxID=35708 RepID=A0A0A9FIW3_ARUDO
MCHMVRLLFRNAMILQSVCLFWPNTIRLPKLLTLVVAHQFLAA